MTTFLYNLIAGYDIGSCLDILLEGYLFEGRKVTLDEPTWIALIAHFLDLSEIHEKSLKTWAKHKPKGIIKDPITITDPETGSPERREVSVSTRKNARIVSEIDPAGFAEWRGLEPKKFTRMVDKYRKKAEAYRRTSAHKLTLRLITRPKPEWSWERKKPGRRLEPTKVFERIKILARYLNAKEHDSSLTMEEFAKTAGIGHQTYLSSQLKKYRPEAEAYRHLVNIGAEIPQPIARKTTTAAEKSLLIKEERKEYKPHVVLLGKEIVYGHYRGRKASETIKDYAKKESLNLNKLTMWYDRLKDALETKVEIAKLTGAKPPEGRKRGRKPKPKKKVVERPKLQTRGSYRAQKKPDAEIDAWVSLADDVEKKGLTRALIVKHADLVGVRVIKRVRSFPTSWGDKQIKNWMHQNVDEYVTLAGPKLEAQLKELGLWNPPAAKRSQVVIPSAPVEESPWRDLSGWTKPGKPRVVIAVGHEGERNIRGHLPWLQKYFDVKVIKPPTFSTVGNSPADVIIALTRFLKHKDSDRLERNIPPGTTYVNKSRSGPLGGIAAAVVAMIDRHKALWFVDAYEKEKGNLHASADWIIANLLEGTMKENIVTKMRELLSSRDSEMLSDMKEKVRHKYRTLQERSRAKLNPSRNVGISEITQDVTAASIGRAVKDLRIHNDKAVGLMLGVIENDYKTLFNPVFWRDIGRGASSFLLHGKFDVGYKHPEVGGAMSREASSLERIGGTLGTSVYKAGRTLQKAEKWFNIEDPEDRPTGTGYARYSRTSAFGRARKDDIDSCVKTRVSYGGGIDYVGHVIGTPGYEKCLGDETEKSNNDRIKRAADVKQEREKIGREEEYEIDRKDDREGRIRSRENERKHKRWLRDADRQQRASQQRGGGRRDTSRSSRSSSSSYTRKDTTDAFIILRKVLKHLGHDPVKVLNPRGRDLFRRLMGAMGK